MKSLCICVCMQERVKNAESSSLLDPRYVGRDLTQHLGLGTRPEKEITQDKSWRTVQLQGILT